ncbi:MAG: twin-arginine translocase TatA/TatE family subunit [Mariniphaga sp.]|jgi:sec-independent protein translocase protein TatA|nr:twin-arginine translocase TatA/TatE family subunit [Mariniphaga sp.]
MEHIVLFLSGGEIMVVVFFALLFFGADAIPGLARTVGKGMREFNKATSDLKSEFENHTADIKQDFNKLTDKIENGTSEVKRKIEDELKD